MATNKKSESTPMMRQYFKLKAQYPDAILLYRIGDFYETFAEDAKKVSDILGIVLTSRNNGGSDIALAGFPHHSLNVYLPRLVKAGMRVAICEQLEKPQKGKQVVRRGVTDVITPGLTMDEELLDNKSNNYLASIHYAGMDSYGISFLDISTGEFLVGQGSFIDVDKLLQSFKPNEIILSRLKEKTFFNKFGGTYYTYGLDDWIYNLDYGEERLLDHFKVKTLKGFGVEEMPNAQIAAGAILHYLSSTENTRINHINNIQRLQKDGYVWLDKFTIRNLELLDSPFHTGKPLIEVLDFTRTPMGGRLLKKWIVLPLTDVDIINKRHNIVDYLAHHNQDQEDLRVLLSRFGDLKRLISRVPMGKIHPKAMKQLSTSLSYIPLVKSLLSASANEDIIEITNQFVDVDEIRALIDKTIVDDPPANFNKGNVIADGAHPEIDDFRYTIKHSKELLADVQAKEAKETGIDNLKVGFNNVFGYYLEVTNKYKNKGMVPEHWVRKQTLKNCERYITDDLKKLEEKILHAEERALELEEEIYDKLVQDVSQHVRDIQTNADIIAHFDCLSAFAEAAVKYHYSRPTIDESKEIDIIDGRHPVIEQFMKLGEEYVPNDIFLDTDKQQILMITGPNMSGKSAILRQTALISLMAQMGSFVPAARARLGIVDKIFSRVGASDNISSGESTFMVEMNETANILNNISDRSLILMDEIGRGTSTYDGISIAWSIAEFLHESPHQPKTLFATHYHELNELEKTYHRIKNYHVATHETGRDVVFLRKLKKGGSQHSFGIHVAKMAGMPDSILTRAGKILRQLEQKMGDKKESDAVNIPVQEFQLQLFGSESNNNKEYEELLSFINEVDVNSMTPIECMIKLKELKELVIHNE